MKRFLPFLLILFGSRLSAQNSVEGTIRNLEIRNVYLMSLYGEKSTIIDSVTADSTGKVRFLFPSNRHQGMYRIQWSKEGQTDLIWNHEDIRFITNSLYPGDSLTILTSLENQIYYTFSRKDRNCQARLELLMPVVDYYPVRDTFYRVATRELDLIQRNQQKSLDSLVRLYPDSYAVRLLRLYQSPFIPSSLTKDERLALLRQHYFDKVDFNDTILLNSPAFANKTISYLSLYSNNRLTQKQLEAEFIKAVTVLLSAASVNAEVYKFLLDYVVGGFDKYHLDEVITYIADNFQDPYSCEDQQRKTALQKKLETFKKIAVGKIAPDMGIPDQKGKIVTLSAVPAEYTLLVFWSSDCPHCTDLLPRLNTLYENQKTKRFEVMAVSMDTSSVAWNNFIRTHKLRWVNVSELKGFAGKAADTYNIYATPTMLLLDREKKILSKPISYRSLEQALREVNLIP